MNEYGLGGKKFSVSIENNEYFQSTYVTFCLDDDGSMEIPTWEDDDERWETYGVVVLKDKAVVMSKVDYDHLSVHYEDDWYDWEDICIILTEDL